MNREAWENYWTEGRASGSVGCLPDSTPELERLQNEFWRATLKPLARKSTVVDLASGDGAVLNAVSTFRRDLRLIGVDYASKLPKPKSKIKLLSNVDMEDLPFQDRSIDAFISRFGIEYGDATKIGVEIFRALKPDGRFAFIMHNSASPIYHINIARSQQLKWSIDEQGIVNKARAFLQSRQLLGGGYPGELANISQTASTVYGPYSVASEFTQAVLHTVVEGHGKPLELCLSILSQLENHARQEVSRIDAMVNASKDNAAIEKFVDVLAEQDLEAELVRALELSGGQGPFAWAVAGIRRPK